MPYPREDLQLVATKGAAAAEEIKVETGKATEDHRVRVMKIVASLSTATAASGLLTVTDGTSTWTTFITTGNTVPLEPEWQAKANTKITVSLAAVTGATGTLAVFWVYE